MCKDCTKYLFDIIIKCAKFNELTYLPKDCRMLMKFIVVVKISN